jgi:hypothetical protein
MAKGINQIAEDFELGQHVHAFKSASDRVRYFLVTIAVACILIFAGYRNSHPDGWTNSRVKLARIALKNEVWNPAALRPKTEDDPALVKLASDWAFRRSLGSKAELQGHLGRLEEIQLENVYIMRMPFLGIGFDINDLGIFSALGLSLLMLMLLFSMSRQHQNLFLCLWKVRQLCARDAEHGKGQSKANLLYHSLAMAQLFTKPPTLARWRKNAFAGLPKLLFLMPLFMQGLLLFHDIETIDFGLSINPKATVIGLIFEGLSVAFIAGCTLVCWLYSRAADQRWRSAFFAVNPGYKDKPQPSWAQWMKISIKRRTVRVSPASGEA